MKSVMSFLQYSRSVDSIKRIAKNIKKTQGIPYHEALNTVVQQDGFSNYTHYLRQSRPHRIDLSEMKNTGRLPSPSETALTLMRMVECDTVTIEEMAALIQTDPSLSLRIIKLANSAAIAFNMSSLRGFSRPGLNVQDGIRLLGTKSVSQVTTALSLIGRHQQGPCTLFNYRFYWSFALARAVSLQSLNAITSILPETEVFSIGLLADIGRLAFASVWPEEYNKCLTLAHSDESLAQLEKEYFGLDYRDASVVLLSEWGFPEEILEAFKSGLNADRTNHIANIANMLACGKTMAQHCIYDDDTRTALLPSLFEQAHELNVSQEKLKSHITLSEQQWRAQGNIIGVSSVRVKNVSDALPQSSLHKNLLRPIKAYEKKLYGDK